MSYVPPEFSDVTDVGYLHPHHVPVRIPSEDEAKVLSQINVVADNLLDKLERALREASPHVDDAAYVREVSHSDDYGSFEVHEFIQTLLAISYVRLCYNSSSSDVALDIAYQLFQDYSLIEKQEVSRYAKRLQKLLSVPNLEITSKASIINSTSDNLFKHCTIVSNLTPIFGSKGQEDSIMASMIRHELCVELINEAETREARKLKIVLDDIDLMRLREVVERAIAKNETLKRFVQAADIQVVPY